jgi:hypothetical protein
MLLFAAFASKLTDILCNATINLCSSASAPERRTPIRQGSQKNVRADSEIGAPATHFESLTNPPVSS